MSYKSNPRQLVMRRDTATGMTSVGWDVELPLGRFAHLELICETEQNLLPQPESQAYPSYQAALDEARRANQLCLQRQTQQNQRKGWYQIPFALADEQQVMQADRFGNFFAAAMQLHYQLTQNRRQAWMVIQHNTPICVRARYPRRELDELTYQVWYHKQLHELNALPGTLLEGELIACESGLWFAAEAA